MPRNAAALSKRQDRHKRGLEHHENPSGHGQPVPPDYLRPSELSIWAELIEPAAKGGFLRREDSVLCAELVQVVVMLRKTAEDKQVPLRKLVLEISDRLGLSPKARAAIDLPEGEIPDFDLVHAE